MRVAVLILSTLIGGIGAWRLTPRQSCGRFRSTGVELQPETARHTNVHHTVASVLLGVGLGLGLVAPPALPTFGFSELHFVQSASAAESRPGALYREVMDLVKDNFFDEKFNGLDLKKLVVEDAAKLDDGADEQGLLRKRLSALGDKYTRLLDKESFESLWKYDAIGVGLLFQSEPGKTMVIAGPPISNSAGEAAGLHKGDLVFSINGKSTKGMSAMDVLDMMSNDKSDTISLEYAEAAAVAVDPASAERKTVTLDRSKQNAVNPVAYSSQRLPNGKSAAYIKFSDFNAEAVPGLKAALDTANREAVDEVLLDLRGNTGGGFQFALNVGGMFMDNKEMATAVGKNGEKSVFRTSYPEGVLYSKPLVVMIDGLSASASEVLAGGLHDNCRAVTVGSNSFGKGKIQAVFGLTNGQGLVMTVAQYITPKGSIIQSKGITPDIPDKGALNPYLRLALGGIPSAPDLANVDFERADELLKACRLP